jgi:hypothetical protein
MYIATASWHRRFGINAIIMLSNFSIPFHEAGAGAEAEFPTAILIKTCPPFLSSLV